MIENYRKLTSTQFVFEGFSMFFDNFDIWSLWSKIQCFLGNIKLQYVIKCCKIGCIQRFRIKICIFYVVLCKLCLEPFSIIIDNYRQLSIISKIIDNYRYLSTTIIAPRLWCSEFSNRRGLFIKEISKAFQVRWATIMSFYSELGGWDIYVHHYLFIYI